MNQIRGDSPQPGNRKGEHVDRKANIKNHLIHAFLSPKLRKGWDPAGKIENIFQPKDTNFPAKFFCVSICPKLTFAKYWREKSSVGL